MAGTSRQKLAGWGALAAASMLTPALAQHTPPVIAIHGGSGTIPRGSLTPELEKQYRDTLSQGTLVGRTILMAGGSAVDAVVAAIRVLEDSPLFNAGKGAVLTSEGRAEMDAAIMDGKTSKAGAVAGVRQVKNPILAARAVMDKTRHVMFAGEGADAFAAAQGLETVPESYFVIERRVRQLEDAKKRQQIQLDHTPPAAPAPQPGNRTFLELDSDMKFGTVGAVALDAAGNMAAATSTGGLTNKMPGRIGDSPVIGAGTFAENGIVAISATGTGEMFMRTVAAHDVAAQIRYAKAAPMDAMTAVLARIKALGGTGGMIAIDGSGKVHFGFNTTGMYRASATGGSEPVVRIYGDE